MHGVSAIRCGGESVRDLSRSTETYYNGFRVLLAPGQP